MNFIDSLSATIEQLTGLIHRAEDFVDQMLNLTVEELYNALDSIENQLFDIRQEGLAIMSALDPGSLRYAAGYWTRGGLRRRWISYRRRSKRGGRWHRGWGQRRYVWRPHHYQQEHNYTRLARNDAITINVRRGNVLMLMPTTQDAVVDILPLVQPVTLPAPTELSEPFFSEASAPQPEFPEPFTRQPVFSEPFTPQPVFAPPSRPQLQPPHSPWPQPRLALPSLRLFSQRARAQPILARYSRARPVFAQPNRRFARAISRPQPVRMYVDEASAMEEPNRLVYEPFPMQPGRFREIASNSWNASSSIEYNYSVTGGPVAPSAEQRVFYPITTEPEQVVPIPIITEQPNETYDFESE